MQLRSSLDHLEWLVYVPGPEDMIQRPQVDADGSRHVAHEVWQCKQLEEVCVENLQISL